MEAIAIRLEAITTIRSYYVVPTQRLDFAVQTWSKDHRILVLKTYGPTVSFEHTALADDRYGYTCSYIFLPGMVDLNLVNILGCLIC